MGTLKLEVNIPDFDKEITIEVTLKKDGKVSCHSTGTSPSENLEQQNNSPKSSSLAQGGNMMNLDI